MSSPKRKVVERRLFLEQPYEFGDPARWELLLACGHPASEEVDVGRNETVPLPPAAVRCAFCPQHPKAQKRKTRR